MARDRREKEELSMVGFHDVFYVPPLLLSFFFPLPSGGTLSFLSRFIQELEYLKKKDKARTRKNPNNNANEII